MSLATGTMEKYLYPTLYLMSVWGKKMKISNVHWLSVFKNGDEWHSKMVLKNEEY
jgi:hypothetical protein